MQMSLARLQALRVLIGFYIVLFAGFFIVLAWVAGELTLWYAVEATLNSFWQVVIPYILFPNQVEYLVYGKDCTLTEKEKAAVDAIVYKWSPLDWAMFAFGALFTWMFLTWFAVRLFIVRRRIRTQRRQVQETLDIGVDHPQG